MFVETFFDLNYGTGKLNVKKLWKPVPDMPPPRPPSADMINNIKRHPSETEIELDDD